VRKNHFAKELDMPMKRYKPEQIVTLLRQIEVEMANGKTTPQVCKEAEITVQTFYRWRKEFGGLKLDQAKKCLRKTDNITGHLATQLKQIKPIGCNEKPKRTQKASLKKTEFHRDCRETKLSGRGKFRMRMSISIRRNHGGQLCPSLRPATLWKN
jgi:putative transposase